MTLINLTARSRYCISQAPVNVTDDATNTSAATVGRSFQRAIAAANEAATTSHISCHKLN